MRDDVPDGPTAAPPAAGPPASFGRLLSELRPKLHRYCARMTGSVVDGEDVVQEALVKAFEALPETGAIANPEGWLFRIAHHAALDFLRRRTRQGALHTDQEPDLILDPVAVVEQRQAASASLRMFMRLPAAQRSSIILMDVLGYSLAEISAVTGGSIPAVKAALHRGRARLHELALQPEDMPLPVLGHPERARLAAYVDRFNARDFDALRDLLADEVRLDLVDRHRLADKSEVSRYFTNYSRIQGWRLVPGWVDRRPAALVRDGADASGLPAYFILLGWAEDRLIEIRDFRYARYALDGAEIATMD